VGVNLSTAVIYFGILTLENVGSAINYSGIFIALAHGISWNYTQVKPLMLLHSN
jgi:hypothetical protein